MSIEVVDTFIPDLKVILPRVFGDARGFFLESWNQKDFNKGIGKEVIFVQDNHSRSKKGVVRGLHFQKYPHAQSKLVRCVFGEIYDVAVDLRTESETFGKWFGIQLSAENKKQLWIPQGFAHGFVALSECAEVLYKTDEHWHPECEGAIRWDDQDLNIEWPLVERVFLSEKDGRAISFKEIEKITA